MKLYICANGYTDRQKREAEACIEELTKAGHDCHLSSAPECDLIISIGGDGALLRAAQTALRYDKPLFGINSGRLGYLCALSIQEISRFEDVLSLCHVHKRTILEYEWEGERKLAVNDVVIGKKNFGQTVDLLFECGDVKMPVRGDGLILATPTGSTAYNYSAGGPLLEGDQKDLAVTPICAHNPEAKPLVIPDDRTLTVVNRRDNAGIYADGEYIGDLKEKITVNASKQILKLLLP